MLVNGRVRYVTITDVTPGSPAAKAGIKRGVMLVAIQRVVFRGLTPAEFEHELETMKSDDWIELGLADPPGRFPDERKGFRVVRLPARKPILPSTANSTRASPPR
jgi:S1-C subfamily serine protease